MSIYYICDYIYKKNYVMFKKFFQALATGCSGTWVGKLFYSNEEMVDYAIDNKLEIEVFDQASQKKLTEEQITKILQTHEGEPTQELVKNYELTEAQQIILCSKKNTLLIENYLAPTGYLERALCPEAEFIYVETMINKTSNIGIEMFKTYVDNNKKTILTDELLKIALEKISSSKEEAIAAKYLIQRAYFTEAQEVYLLEHSTFEMMEEYLAIKQIYQEESQIRLVEKFYELAKIHQEDYGLRPKALQLYRSKRKEELQILHPEGAVP